jgi:DNA-binding transcriptional LysR family regulator
MPLSARMPELSAFEVLLAIAKTGSLSAAGREVGLTQQAISSRLTSIEAQAGVQLVARTTRGSQLTQAGVVVAEWADQLLDVANLVDAGLESLRAQSRNRVKVVASLTIAKQFLPRWMVSLQAATSRRGGVVPQVLLTAANSDKAISAVLDGAADVGFVESPSIPRQLRSRVVGHDELVVIVPPEHKWARRSMPVTALELSRTPLVMRESGSGTRDSLGAALRRVLGDKAEQVPPVIELTSATAVRAAVLAGAGPAVTSPLAVADDLRVGRLRAVGVPDLDLRRELRASWVGGRTPPAGAIRDLLSHISSIR